MRRCINEMSILHRTSLAAVAALLLCGCGEGTHYSAPVKPDVARQTLELTLKEWQSGSKVDALRGHTPEIVVQDLDWNAGTKLLAFEVLGDGEAIDANLYAKVKLTLQAADGKEVEKTVTYCVGTSPVLTVFRDPTR